jgi:hypothetical protein
MKNRIAIALALILSAPLLYGQDSSYGVDIPLFSARDLTETAFTFCATFGDSSTVSKEPWKKPDPRTRIVTSGSSTTVTGLAGVPSPFTNVAAGDELSVVVPVGTVANTTGETIVLLYVAARASADSITIGPAAVDLGTTGMSFNYRTRTCGTAATSGRVATDGFKDANFQFEWTTKNATSLDFKVECKVKGSNTGWVVTIPTTGASTNLTAVGAYSNRILGVDSYDYCRFGMQINADSGVNTVNGAVRLTK